MNNLFTVDYALNYEGWKYVKNIAPYNVYSLGQFTVRVRRNDFYLLLYINNACNNLVFCGRIYTIEDYKVKVKKHLDKWKCQISQNNAPTPPTQGLVLNNYSYANTFIVGDTPNIIISTGFNEDFTILDTSLTASNLELAKSGSNIVLQGAAVTPNTYGQIVRIQGNITGVILNITLNITIVPSASYILLENGSFITLETNSGFTIQE